MGLYKVVSSIPSNTSLLRSRSCNGRLSTVLSQRWATSFQTQWLGGLAQFGEQELAVLIVQHADAPGLRQHGPYQTQLPSRRRIAPEQAELIGEVIGPGVGGLAGG